MITEKRTNATRTENIPLCQTPERVYEDCQVKLENTTVTSLLPTTPSVKWPRYTEGNAGIIDAGLEDGFSSL